MSLVRSSKMFLVLSTVATLMGCGGREASGDDSAAVDATSAWDARAHLGECCNPDSGGDPPEGPVDADGPDNNFGCPVDDTPCQPLALCGFRKNEFDITGHFEFGCCFWDFDASAPPQISNCNPPP